MVTDRHLNVCVNISKLTFTSMKKNSVSLKLYLAVHSRPCLRVSLQQSSVCGAGLHSGVIDNDGGWLDVTRLGRKQQFTKSYKNGIQSIGYESDSVFGFLFSLLSKSI